MKYQRIKMTVLSLCVVLSLFASAIAACACPHHQKKSENHNESCHQQMTRETQDSEFSNSNEAAQTSKIDADCACFVKSAQPFVVGKIENVKNQKNSAVLPSIVKFDNRIRISTVTAAKFEREHHFYNSNYLEKLKPSRAPPVL